MTDGAILARVDNTEDRVEPEVRRLAELLAMVVRMSGRSRRSIEAELGLGSSGLSKILNGTVRLQVSHVVSILQAVGVEPGEFFQAAFPRRGSPRRSGLMKEVRLLLEPDAAHAAHAARAADTGPGEADDQEDFDERVRLVMLRLLGGRPQSAN